MYSVGTYGQKFEIAAPETHFFKEYFHIREDKSNVCGLGHSTLQLSACVLAQDKLLIMTLAICGWMNSCYSY